jgi:hypothetical protein
MATKVKRKMVNVSPISNKAKDRFVNVMNKLHGCHVEQETNDKLFLASINKKYLFCIDKLNDFHWRLIT